MPPIGRGPKWGRWGKTDNPDWVSGRKIPLSKLWPTPAHWEKVHKFGKPTIPVMPLFWEWIKVSRPMDRGKGPTAGQTNGLPFRWRALAWCSLLVGSEVSAIELAEKEVTWFQKQWLPIRAWMWLGRWLRWRYIMLGPCGGRWVDSIFGHPSAECLHSMARVILKNRRLPPWWVTQLRAARWPREVKLVPGRRLPRNMVAASIIRGD